MDSSFHLGRPLSSDGDSSSARNIQPNTSSLSLPPLRSIDPLVQQFGTHQAQGPGLAAQLPSPNFPPISQYHPPLPGISHHHGSMPSGYPPSNLHEAGTPGGPMDPFPQPPSLLISPTEVHRALATGRQKKEVKRRTKTGCLTCRKRRIKVSHFSVGVQTRWQRSPGVTSCQSYGWITIITVLRLTRRRHESWRLNH